MLYPLGLFCIQNILVCAFHKKSNEMIVDEKYMRGEVLSSGWIIKRKQGDMKTVHMTYILQLGTKALSLAVGDMTGETKVVAMSLANVRSKFVN